MFIGRKTLTFCKCLFYIVGICFRIKTCVLFVKDKISIVFDFIEVFPQHTPEEKRLFELIKTAYVNGRYDPDFIVNKEDIDAFIEDIDAFILKVELLRNITKRI